MTSKRRRKTTRSHGRDAEGRVDVPVDVPVEGPQAPHPTSPEDPAPGAPGEASNEVEAEVVAPELVSPELVSPEAMAEARTLELEDRLRRVQADFANETKRIARQADERRKYAVEGLARDLIPVLDALHSAGQSLAEAGEDVRQGFDLVEKELLNVLGRHGVERIEADGQPFDPSLHEALYVQPHSELPPNTVAQVLRPGFMLHGRLVRAAQVAVSKADESGEGPEAQDGPVDEGR